ncbi:MAG TPA: hypothetical protein VG456_02025 [Candidatus Sulfopaludibacter sp.]|nr:hypothetical protein [Candidatus Sulfopaludibacter sp.]
MKMAILVVALAAAAAGKGRQEPAVVVFLHHGTESAAIVGLAEKQAEGMLRPLGISVEWRLGAANYHGTAEVVETALTNQEAAGYHPGALAYATLGVGSGTRIQVFYDRIQAAGPPSATSAILAHVLVHEITHILEGVERHSETGVMKARWEPRDFRQMRASLPFAAEDVQLLQAWAARHKAADKGD